MLNRYVAAAALVLLALPTLCAADPSAAAKTHDPAPQELVLQLAPKAASDDASDMSAVKPNGFIDSLCGLATQFLGTPYRWGGTTPKAFDCSGFVRYVYGKLGIKLPRTARQQYKVGDKVTFASLQAGDLIFFDMMKGYVSHVGMYIGGGKFIHAANPRRGVRIDCIDKPAYKNHIVGARRYAA